MSARRRLNIGHKHGGSVVDITAVGHDTYKGRAYWFFKGRVEWADGSHKRDPDAAPSEISPAMLCWPEDGKRADLDRAMHAINEYLARAGAYEAHSWVPHEPRGEEPLSL